MSVNSVTSRNDYVGTGLVTTYSYNFRIFLESHLLVTKRTSAFVETTLVLNTDYTVTGVGDAPGGTIILATALEDDALLTIRRVLPLTQPTDIRDQGPFFPGTHEDAFDRAIMIVQQQQDILNRSFRAPENEASIGELPNIEERASKFLAFDADGDPIASSGSIDSIPVSSFVETLLDDITSADARVTLEIPVVDDLTLQEVAGVMSVKTAMLTPPGVISAYGGTTAPTGYLICDGSEVNRTTYAALFSVIGEAFGRGDNTNTFNLPDLRGRFLRGKDGAVGRDPDASARTAMNTGGNTGDNVGSIQGDKTSEPSTGLVVSTSADHTHTQDGNQSATFNTPGTGAFSVLAQSGTKQTSSGGSHNHTLSGWDNETRPLNAYVNYIIKY